jgi:hypothetical protein
MFGFSVATIIRIPQFLKFALLQVNCERPGVPNQKAKFGVSYCRVTGCVPEVNFNKELPSDII